jgi:TatD DNase family protein
MITIGVDVQTSIQCVQLAENYPQLYAAVGIHPNDGCRHAKWRSDNKIDHLLTFRKWWRSARSAWISTTTNTAGTTNGGFSAAFSNGLWTANLPIVLHTRQAEERVIACLHQLSPNGWQGAFIVSAATHSKRTAMAMGFHLSFTGNITYKNSHTFAVMKSVALGALVAETDSPLMPPVPYRGQRNERRSS